jgi:hypothetical protein
MTDKDPFDQWWEWVTFGHVTDFKTIPARIRDAIMMLTPEEQRDRAIVNGAGEDESETSRWERGSVWGSDGGGVREGLRAARRNRPPRLKLFRPAVRNSLPLFALIKMQIQ